MAQIKVKTRLFVDNDLAQGAIMGLGPLQAHYLHHVLRLKSGDSIALFNGRDGEWLGNIDGLGRGWCSLAIVGRRRPQALEPDLWLVFAPIKRARLDFLVQKATELGVSALWPVFTRHSQITRVNAERLRANAIDAAQQCERLGVPEVFEACALDEAIARWPGDRRLLVCAESGAAPPISAALAREAARVARGGAKAEPWSVLVGPEGGFSRSELDALQKLPFVTAVGMGPRVLRADTAALAALACWQAFLGDWPTQAPRRR